MVAKRQFSHSLQASNLRFVGNKHSTSKQARVGFLLLQNFSLPAFTQALDTLVTANLICPQSFLTQTYSLDGESIVSDLGLMICPDAQLKLAPLRELDLLVVCAGLRTPLAHRPELIQLLRAADAQGVSLAGLWSGAWFLADANLLGGYRCTIHPEHRATLVEMAPDSLVTCESYIIDRKRLTAASSAGALNMILEWVGEQHSRALADAIVEILAFEEARFKRTSPAIHDKMSAPLRDVIGLMSANIDEPLSQEQLSQYVGRSKRQIERLFRDQLGTTPVRYYLELRITESRRLLQHSELSMVEVAVACGFVSPSHFSKCYTSFYGYSPSKEQRFGCIHSTKPTAGSRSRQL